MYHHGGPPPIGPVMMGPNGPMGPGGVMGPGGQWGPAWPGSAALDIHRPDRVEHAPAVGISTILLWTHSREGAGLMT